MSRALEKDVPWSNDFMPNPKCRGWKRWLVVCLGCVIAVFLADFLLGLSSRVSKPTMKISLRELLSVSIELARRGGEEVVAARLNHSHAAGPWDAPGRDAGGDEPMMERADDMAHKADVNSFYAMILGLKKAFPQLNIFSLDESGSSAPVDLAVIEAPKKQHVEIDHIEDKAWDHHVPLDDIQVWINPLDGMMEYKKDRQEQITTTVCIAVRGKAVIGVIHHAFSGVTDWGYVGFGHSQNLRKHSTAGPAHQAGSPHHIISSRAHAGTVKEMSQATLGSNVKVHTAGGLGYIATQILKGNYDAYVDVAFRKADTCAGHAILKTLGGNMTTLDGREINYSRDANENKEDEALGVLATLTSHQLYLALLKPGFELCKMSHSNEFWKWREEA